MEQGRTGQRTAKEILLAGERTGWVKRQAAARLGVSRPTLDLWIARLRLAWPKGKGKASGKGQASKAGESSILSSIAKESAASPNSPLTGAGELAILGSHMASAATVQAEDPKVAAQLKLRGSIWRWARKHAIDRNVIPAKVVEDALEMLRAERAKDGGTE